MENNSKTMNQKSKKMLYRQGSLIEETDGEFKTLGGIEKTVFVKELIYYAPKQPSEDRFNELHFLAYIIKLESGMRENGVCGENFLEA